MTEHPPLTELPTDELYVLLGLVNLEFDGLTPAHSPAVEDACGGIPVPDADVVGRLSEAEVSRALNTLEAKGVVETGDDTDRSPTGKGRPTYTLVAATDAVIQAGKQRDALKKTAAAVEPSSP